MDVVDNRESARSDVLVVVEVGLDNVGGSHLDLRRDRRAARLARYAPGVTPSLFLETNIIYCGDNLERLAQFGHSLGHSRPPSVGTATLRR
jgi:hypothetical protein